MCLIRRVGQKTLGIPTFEGQLEDREEKIGEGLRKSRGSVVDAQAKASSS